MGIARNAFERPKTAARKWPEIHRLRESGRKCRISISVEIFRELVNFTQFDPRLWSFRGFFDKSSLRAAGIVNRFINFLKVGSEHHSKTEVEDDAGRRAADFESWRQNAKPCNPLEGDGPTLTGRLLHRCRLLGRWRRRCQNAGGKRTQRPNHFPSRHQQTHAPHLLERAQREKLSLGKTLEGRRGSCWYAWSHRRSGQVASHNGRPNPQRRRSPWWACR